MGERSVLMFPILDDVMVAEDVSTKGTGKFAASYVNWSKTAMYLRKHAPGWQPFAERNAEGGMVHTAPDGTFFLLIGFCHVDPEIPRTVTVPHAVMDHSMKPKKNPDARDISDAFVRGLCKAAAMLFGLGWRLWSKDDPFEREDEPAPVKVQAKQAAPAKRTFASPDEAANALTRCTEQKHVDAWTTIAKQSGFLFEEVDSLLELANERRALLENNG
jgi:hypothetical protein